MAEYLWRFGKCELNELRRELRVDGRVVEIEAKPFDVLLALLRRTGQVAGKEDLMNAVWPDLEVVDGSLATAVSKLRKALGAEQDWVVTVPRIGYRLAAAPEQVHKAVAATEGVLEPGVTAPGRSNWRLLRPLRSQRPCDVWLAEHPKTGEQRVFKYAHSDRALKSLQREVTIARLLRESLGERPEFVRLFEWNLETAPYFLELEYVGPNLQEWAEEAGGLAAIALEDRLVLVARVARVTAEAHGLQVLHKDLKPSNLLVRSGGAGAVPQIVLSDFGSSALLEEGSLTDFGITNLGFNTSRDGSPGTALYTAPEVLMGHAATAASDVYALGLLLYQMVAGDFRKPLAPGWEHDVQDAALRDAIGRAAASDPARRYSSAVELAEAVERLGHRREDAVSRRSRVGKAAILAAAILLLVTGAILYGRRQAALPPLQPVAVLPFENAGPDPSLEYLRLGLADEVATLLLEARGLRVKAVRDERARARDLPVKHVVTGRFRKAGESILVTVEAVDARSGELVWQDTLTAPAASTRSIQMQLALRVRGQLIAALGGTPGQRATEPRSDKAYELFLRSTAFASDAAANREAVRILEESVAIDPNYPPAWMALSRRYYMDGRYGSGDASLLQKGEEAAQRALELDPDSVNASAGLIISRVERGDVAGALRQGEDMVRRRADSVDAHFSLSYALRFAGLLDESASHCETAFLLDQRTDVLGLRSCAVVFLLLGDESRAMNYLRVDEGSDFARSLRMDIQMRQGRDAEAVRIGSEKPLGDPSYRMLLACASQAAGAEVARLAAAVSVSDDPETNYFRAAHLARCGEIQKSLMLLKRAVEGNYCSYPAMDQDPLFVSVRGEAEFAQVRAAGMACRSRFMAARF